MPTPMDTEPPRLPGPRPLQLEADLAEASLASWPGLRVDYAYRGQPEPGRRRLELGFSLDLADEPAADGVTTPQQQARADAMRWQGIARLLAHEGASWHLVSSLDGGGQHALDPLPLRQLAAEAQAWLEACAEGTKATPPNALCIPLAIEPSNPQDLFELVVELVLQLPAARPGQTPRRISHRIMPRHGPVERGAVQARDDFAADLEAATAEPGCALKVARAVAQHEADGLPPLWVLRVCTEPDAAAPCGLRWQLGAPCHFAPPPLARSLLTRADVPIPGFDAQRGIDWTSGSLQHLHSIALDDWARRALAALDAMLSPDRADVLSRLDACDWPPALELPKVAARSPICGPRAMALQPPPASRPLLVSTLEAIRRDLAAAVATTLQPILQPGGLVYTPGVEARSEAVLLMWRLMRQQAEQAYLVGALCQWPVLINGRLDGAAASASGPPRLRCIPVVAGTAHVGLTGQQPTLSAALPPLADGPSWVTLALTPTDGGARSHALLDLRLLPHGVEWPGDDPDQPECLSRRLRLLRPRVANAPDLPLGQVDVPLPLRRPPPSPSLHAQSANAVPVAADDAAGIIAAVRRWQFELTFGAAQAAQDTLRVDIGGPVTAASEAPALPHGTRDHPDLFDHLARWALLWPVLEPALEEALIAWQAAPADANAVARAQVLAADTVRLLAPLATAWTDWVGVGDREALTLRDPGARSSPLFWFSLQEQEGDVGELRAWVVRQTVAVADESAAERSLDDALVLTLTVDDGATDSWRCEDAAQAPSLCFLRDGAMLGYQAARGLPLRGARLGSLDVMGCAGLQASVTVLRNQVLLQDSDGRPLQTAPAFVYALPTVHAAASVFALLSRREDCDIAALSTPRQQTLATHLESLLGRLMQGLPEASGRRLRLETSLQLPLGATSGWLPYDLPMLLLEAAPLSTQAVGNDETWTPARMANLYAEAIRRWFADQKRADGGTLRLSVTMFDAGTQADGTRLRWEGARLLVSDVCDIPGPGTRR